MSAAAAAPGSRVLHSKLLALEKLLMRLLDRPGLLPLAWQVQPRGVAVLPGSADALAAMAVLADAAPEFAIIADGPRRLDAPAFSALAAALSLEPQWLDLPLPLDGDSLALAAVDDLFRRFDVHCVRDAGLWALRLDGLAEKPLQQASQLAALAAALQQARRALSLQGIVTSPLLQARADGFHIWSRQRGAAANVALFQLVLLLLGERALARRSGALADSPALTAAFGVGTCSCGRWAGGGNDMVAGSLPLALESMLRGSAPGELLVGDFRSRIPTSDREGAFLIDVDTVAFVERAGRSLARPAGLELSGFGVRALHCFVSGERTPTVQPSPDIPRPAHRLRINLHVEGLPTLILGKP